VDCIGQLTLTMAAKEPVALITVIEAPDQPELIGQHALISPSGLLCSELADEAVLAAAQRLGQEALASGDGGAYRVGSVRLYVEPHLPPPALVVVGAGHVAQQVAHFGKLLGFDLTVLDDRPEYANRIRFPDADTLLCAEFVPSLQQMALGPRHYIVLVTRGHRQDMECLHEVITKPVAYVGMIGSRTRIETVFRLLETEHGINPASFGKVYTPIGLDIGARTPVEIGVAVAAELIKVRNGGSGESLSRLNRVRVHER
jgi:xanthine dehydrogenase accessory factor